MLGIYKILWVNVYITGIALSMHSGPDNLLTFDTALIFDI